MFFHILKVNNKKKVVNHESVLLETSAKGIKAGNPSSFERFISISVALHASLFIDSL